MSLLLTSHVLCVLIGVDRRESCSSAKATPTHIHRHRFFLGHPLSSAVVFIAAVGFGGTVRYLCQYWLCAAVVASTSLHSQALPRKSCRHEKISRRFLRTRMPVRLCHLLGTPSTCDGKDGSARKRIAERHRLAEARPSPTLQARNRTPLTAL